MDMKLRITKRIGLDRMTKHQRQDFFENIEREISNLEEEDLKKLIYARDLTNELQLILDAEECNRIQIGPIDIKTLEYFIFTILLEYESMYRYP